MWSRAAGWGVVGKIINGMWSELWEGWVWAEEGEREELIGGLGLSQLCIVLACMWGSLCVKSEYRGLEKYIMAEWVSEWVRDLETKLNEVLMSVNVWIQVCGFKTTVMDEWYTKEWKNGWMKMYVYDRVMCRCYSWWWKDVEVKYGRSGEGAR